MAYTIDLSGKTAVITGSNSGIGLGIAWELARAGADVVLNSYTDSEEDHAIASEIATQTGVTARYISADMSKGDQCRRLITDAGACDILVNNAGASWGAPLDEFPENGWDKVMDTNVKGIFFLTQKCLRCFGRGPFSWHINRFWIALSQRNYNID